MRRPIKRFIRCALLICALAPAVQNAGAAQDLLRAAAVVNDEVISVFDLDMRLRLAILATGQKDNRKLRDRMTAQVIRTLIDEQLQKQEAERLGITITDEQVTNGAEEIARRNKLTIEGFAGLLERRGILLEAFLDQIRGQLTWSALVVRRLRPSVQVSNEEVEEVVRRIAANRGTRLRRVSEIFLAVDTALREDEVRRNAERLLEQLRAGARFSSLARQFSESATAARGGDLGWIRDGQLPEEIDKALARMRPGMLSRPIRTLSGFHILLLGEEKQTSLGEVMLHLKQILIAIPSGASEKQRRAAAERAGQARERIAGCAGLDALAGEIGAPGSGDLGTVKSSNLPAPIRDAVMALPIGQPSRPVSVSGGLAVLVVCNRAESGIDRQRIAERLTAERLDMLARRYMRDLRRSANVDIRL
ncbi:MAG: peptidylprolyl isomerase [Proteobacteria bacterium]|nr:peptidylprolyl isomerase [Pseudomonadota bacterium]